MSTGFSDASSHPLYPQVHQTFLDYLNDVEAAQIAALAVLDSSDAHWQISLLEHLLGIELTPEDVQVFWHQGVTHWEKLNAQLGRDPGLTVALIDYCKNISENEYHFTIFSSGSNELSAESPRDGLSGLSNLRYFKSRLNAEAARNLRYQKPFVVAIVDIDCFTSLVKDRGTEAGNEVIRRLGGILNDTCRKTDIASRINRHQMALLFLESEKKDAFIQLERIRTRAEIELKEFQTTLSGGMASCPHDARTAEELMKCAERSLTAAKEKGMNRVCIDPEDKRAFPRLHESLMVRLTPLSEGEAAREAITRDISGGGFAFESPDSIAPGQAVKGEIELPDRTISFLGKVARAEELGGGRFEIGLEFTAIDPESRYRLLSFAR